MANRSRRPNAVALGGFDAYKRVKGRKRHILVDTLGLLVADGSSSNRADSRLFPPWPPCDDFFESPVIQIPSFAYRCVPYREDDF